MDFELVRGRVSDEESFAWFFTSEYPRVVRLLGVVLGDSTSAEDIAQDAFLRLHKHWAKVSRYDAPEAWVRRVAINRSLTWRRREWLRREREMIAHVEQATTLTHTGALAPDDRREVIDAVRRLKPRERALVGLYHLEDRPLAEVAEVLGLREGAAKVALHRARRRLAELLADPHDREVTQ